MTATTLDFIGKKAKDLKDPNGYAVITGPGYRTVVLKRWSKDDAKPYARWLVAQDLGLGPGYGDTYVSDIVSIAAQLVSVDGETPTAEQQEQFTALKVALSQQDGGIRVF